MSETFREAMDRFTLRELEGGRFRDLIRFAHDRGLLAGLLREAGIHQPYASPVYRSTQLVRRLASRLRSAGAHSLRKCASKINAI
jgi:hypothetical protein